MNYYVFSLLCQKQNPCSFSTLPPLSRHYIIASVPWKASSFIHFSQFFSFSLISPEMDTPFRCRAAPSLLRGVPSPFGKVLCGKNPHSGMEKH